MAASRGKGWRLVDEVLPILESAEFQFSIFKKRWEHESNVQHWHRREATEMGSTHGSCQNMLIWRSSEEKVGQCCNFV